MKKAFSFVASVLALSALSLTASVSSCKSNDITQNNNTDYESFSSQAVSPESGGEVDGPDGAKVVIDPGALATTTTIGIGKLRTDGATHPYPDLPSGWQAAGGIYSFEPHAQPFAKDAHLTVPYSSTATALRVVGCEPGGAWSPIDGATVQGGFATFDSPHFSFYTLVTGAPAEPRDAGRDGAIDAASDASADAASDAPSDSPNVGPFDSGPGPTTLFVSGNAAGSYTVYRFGLLPPGADAGADAGDSGAFAFWSGSSLAMSGAPYTLYVGAAAGDAGSVTPIDDALGAYTPGGPFKTGTLNSAFTYIEGELWLYNASKSRLETYANTNAMTWSSPMPGALALTYDGATKTVYVLSLPEAGAASQVQPYTLSGSAAGKALVAKGAAWTTLPVGPTAIAFAPWNQLLVAGTTVHRYDTAGNDLGAYSAIQAMFVGGLAVARWPSGVDEIFVANSEAYGVDRFVFAPGDSAHSSPTKNGTLPLPSSAIPYSLVAAP